MYECEIHVSRNHVSEGVSIFKACTFLQCVNYLLYVEVYNINMRIYFFSL